MAGEHLKQLRTTAEALTRQQDAFGKAIADGTRNTLDIPSHYDFNPERHRLRENGARVSPADVPGQFTDTADAYELSPDAGNSMAIYTAERPRYIVGYDAQVSTAGLLSTPLEAGDTYTVGMRDYRSPENKAFFEINGDSDNRLVLQSQGTEVASTTFKFPRGIDATNPLRYEVQYNSYNAGRYQFVISYTDADAETESVQQNEVVGELSVDDDFAVADWNQHIFHELDAATSGKSVETGSYAYVILGDVNETNRVKGASFRGLDYGGSGDFEALAALRIDRARDNVYAQMENLAVFPDGGGGELVVIVVGPDQTDATGFNTPVEHSPKNSVVETTTNVTEFPDVDGNTVTSDPNPNGYQIGFATFESAGTGSNTRSSVSQTVENKRPLYDDNVALFLYKADSTSSRSVNVNYFIEQDW